MREENEREGIKQKKRKNGDDEKSYCERVVSVVVT